MPSKHIPLIAVITWLLLPASAQADACKHTDDCVYGSAVADRWILGSRAAADAYATELKRRDERAARKLHEPPADHQGH